MAVHLGATVAAEKAASSRRTPKKLVAKHLMSEVRASIAKTEAFPQFVTAR
jgi:hypothetical protein